MNTSEKVQKLLKEYYTASLEKKKVIEESAKLVFTPEKNGKRWIIIRSNKGLPHARNSETAKIGAKLKLKKGEQFEREFIVAALRKFKGRINKTSLHTNIPKKTLLRKLEKYEINAKDFY